MKKFVAGLESLFNQVEKTGLAFVLFNTKNF